MAGEDDAVASQAAMVDTYRLRLLLHCGVTWQAHQTARLRGRAPRLVGVGPTTPAWAALGWCGGQMTLCGSC
jgi:hypothetical protein